MRAAALVVFAGALVTAGVGTGAPASGPTALTRSAPADTLMEYDVAGVHVIHQRRTTAADVVAVDLYLLGGSRQISQDNAGIEPFLLRASEYGTSQYPGDAARLALARTGGGIGVAAGPDWTTFGFAAIAQEFDSTWAVFADRLLHPTLDSTAVAMVRSHMLSEVEQRLTSPEAYAVILAESLAFRGHAYAARPTGSERSIKALSVDDLRKYAHDQLVTSRMLLVVVGDVSREVIEKKVTASLGTLPPGAYKWTLPPPLSIGKTEIVTVNRALSTNYIIGYMAGPARTSRDYAAFERAVEIWGGQVSGAIRGQAGLSYSAGVDVIDQGAPGAIFYVSTKKPDEAVLIANYMPVGEPSRGQLREWAKSSTTGYLYSMETADRFADVLARSFLYDGDARAASRRSSLMEKITSDDFKHLGPWSSKAMYAFVGDTAKLPRSEMLRECVPIEVQRLGTCVKR